MADGPEPQYVDDADEDEGGSDGDEGEDQAFDAAARSVETAPLETRVEPDDVQAATPSHEAAIDSTPDYPPAEAPIERPAESEPAEAPDQPLPPERVGD